MESEIIEEFEWKGNVLLYRGTGRKVKRVRPGLVAFKGKLWKTGEIIGILMQEKRDGRQSISMETARSYPDLKISRAEAESLKMTVYRTGRACKAGHTSWRYLSNGACLECLGKL